MSHTCPVCAAEGGARLVERASTPVLQNAVYPDAATARAAAVGDLAFRRCEACGFVWDAALVPERLVYGPGYETPQSHSAPFQHHLASRAAACALLMMDAAPRSIVEVGC